METTYKVLDAKHHSPAEFPFEVLSQIFYGLMVPDLLNISLVCKTWANVIGSPKFLKFIRIRSDERVKGRDVHTMWNMLKKTDREYENIAIFNVNRGVLMPLNELGFKWKSLFFNGCTFKTAVDLLNLLKSVKDTAVTLSFDHMIYSCKIVREVIEETVVMPHLTELIVDCIYCSDDENILNILSPNYAQIKSLKMAYNFFIERFMKYIPPTMQLTLIHLHQTSSSNNMLPIVDFLRSQRHCLKDVRLDSINTDIFQLVWNEFTVMTKFTIGNKMVNLIAKDMNLIKHPTLIEMRFQLVVAIDILSKIFDAVPNLLFLYVPEMNRDVIVMAAEKLKHLIFLHVWTLKGVLTEENKKFTELKKARVFQYLPGEDDEPLRRIKALTYQTQVKMLMKMLRETGV